MKPVSGEAVLKAPIRAVGIVVATGLISLVVSLADAAPVSQSLAALIRDGNHDAVLAAITSPDIDVDAREPDGSTALLWATYKVDHELVRALLKKGAKANLGNDFGSSPLIEAVKLGDVDLTRMLLGAHADANSPNQDGQTALMLASSVGSREDCGIAHRSGCECQRCGEISGPDCLDVGRCGKSSRRRGIARGPWSGGQTARARRMTGRGR